MTVFVSLLGAILLGLAALVAVFLGGMRAKWPPVVDAVRRLNMRVMNPRQMETAGQPGAFAGILRHTGRTSGKAYETPVGIEPTDDGFVIAMVYGERTQWARNVLAAGTATVIVEGQTYEVDRPELVPVAEVDRRLLSHPTSACSASSASSECLRLHKVAETD